MYRSKQDTYIIPNKKNNKNKNTTKNDQPIKDEAVMYKFMVPRISFRSLVVKEIRIASQLEQLSASISEVCRLAQEEPTAVHICSLRLVVELQHKAEDIGP